ncbi:MAG: 2-succinyl-5-enolpyruvyl-6-hydroxy-3-cyclohexene-1-carboxylic-acid synthase [Kutzneria sp.]|nr:2-succinyl-5-enolpyruvyl-6-hydroxy-3-cyclohexene-1-carboxylic-acid synthase [Kutzneria sp.]
MNPSTAQARVVVDELVRNGVRHAVSCPGSRNAPLSFALHEAAVAGRLELHVRIDERSAGFLALGLSKGWGNRPRPDLVAVVCTSGTAVANLHPAVLEAYHSGEPLIVLTADRPAELVGSGANQTTTQHGIFGPLVPTVDFPIAERRAGQNAVWRGMVCRSLPVDGPVHLNLPLREPLVPAGGADWPEPLDGRADGKPWTSTTRAASCRAHADDLGHLSARTLVVVGDVHRSHVRWAGEVADKAGWPVIAEPSGRHLADTAAVITCGGAMLAAGSLPDRLRPESVLVIGRPTLSRGVQLLLRETPVVHVVSDGPRWADPQCVATHVSGPIDKGAAVPPPDSHWLAGWQAADSAVRDAMDALLTAQPWPSGLRLASELVAALPPESTLFLGSSNPVRDVDLVAWQRHDIVMLANRGLAGIDGTVSSAIGVMLGSGGRNGYALLGDLTFLHDINGLLLGPDERRPNLTVVVLNDDGGGIFSLLEQGSGEHTDSFERIFGTPHGADLAALCAGYHVPHQLVTTVDELRRELTPSTGIHVVEVRSDRAALRDLHARLRRVVADALATHHRR